MRTQLTRLLGPLLGVCGVAILMLLAAGSPPPAHAAPANDNFNAAVTLSPSTTQSTAAIAYIDTTGATTEAGEPTPCGGIGSTAWYNWTAPSNAPVNIDTFGSTFDTVLAIYTGNAVNALTTVGCNDDYMTPSRPSLIRFTPVANTTYRIQVGGFNSSQGTVALNFSINATLLVGTTADNLNADGALSLREALMVSNGSFTCAGLVGAEITAAPGCSGSGSNIIHFLNGAQAGLFSPGIPGTITLGSSLPLIGNNDILSGLGAAVTIDGVNQSFDCLTVTGDENHISGLTVRGCNRAIEILDGFSNSIGIVNPAIQPIAGQSNTLTNNIAGVYIEGPSQNEVYGNYIGTNAAGAASLGNFYGVDLRDAGNQIIGSGGTGRNIISGNQYGVWLREASQNNFIHGNYIGTNPAGTSALGNQVGVILDQFSIYVAPFQTTSSNTIFGNVISGNTDDGVRAQGKYATFNAIEQNTIGLNAAGTAALPNGGDGIDLYFASSNTIGGGAGVRNIISGNAGYGIRIESANQEQPSGDVPKAIPDLATITSNLNVSGGFPIQDLTVTVNLSHTFDGDLNISLIPPTGPTIQLSNRRGGGGDNFTNTVFDDEALVPISAGSAPFTGSFRPDTALSQLDGIVNPGGTWRLQIADVAGGDSGTLHGWSLHFRDGGNVVSQNFIGTSADGYSGMGNSQGGMRVFYSQANLITGNVVSGNVGNGINVLDPNSTDNRIVGNNIGTDRDGAYAIPNTGFPVTGRGIQVEARRNTIGGSAPGTRNIISGNATAGIVFDGVGTTENLVQGNYIGLGANGSSAIPNTFDGISIGANAHGQTIGGSLGPETNSIYNNGLGIGILGSNNLVYGNDIRNNSTRGIYIGGPGNKIGAPGPGGSISPQGNYISGNASDGVHVDGAGAVGNSIRGNSIYNNTGLGINNVSGGNTELAPPVITSGMGNVTGTACANCAVDVYRDDNAEGEGFVYLGSVNADGAGTWTFTGAIQGPNVTATATNAGGNTSEFSATFVCGNNDTDSFSNCGDSCPAWPNPSQTKPNYGPLVGTGADSDCDGVSDTRETYLGTAPLLHCAANNTGNNEDPPDRWPFDMNDNQIANTIDVGQFVFVLNETTAEAGSTRLDFNGNGIINTIDVGAYVFVLNKTCSPNGP